METELSYLFDVLENCKNSSKDNIMYFQKLLDKELKIDDAIQYVELVIDEAKLDIIKDFLQINKYLESTQNKYDEIEKKQIKFHLRSSLLEEKIEKASLKEKLTGLIRLELYRRNVDNLFEQEKNNLRIQAAYKIKISYLEKELESIEEKHNQYKAYIQQCKDIERFELESLSLLL